MCELRCPLCPHRTSNLFTLNFHLKREHARQFNRNQPIKCKQRRCHRTLPNYESFIRHTKKKHIKQLDNKLNVPSESSESPASLAATRDPQSAPSPSVVEQNETLISPREWSEARASSQQPTALQEPDSSYSNVQNSSTCNVQSRAKVCTCGNEKVANDSQRSEIYSNYENATLYSNFEKKVLSNATNFVANLYSYPKLPRNLCHEIIQKINNVYLGTLNEIKNFLKSRDDNNEEILELINIAEQSFHDFSTEYKTFEFFKNTGSFIEPKRVIIDAETSLSLDPNYTISDLHVIPLKKVLKKYLELPYVFDSIINNIRKLSTDGIEIFTSVIQGKLWKEILGRFDGNKIVFPIIIYFDDFVINNPLGSHKALNKLGAIYCSIAGLPPEFASLLENIF